MKTLLLHNKNESHMHLLNEESGCKREVKNEKVQN